MKPSHVPRIDSRYWLAIFLASVFGTNTGDLYAHELGLGLWPGLLLLTLPAAVAFAAERRDPAPREAWYWLVILIIRTGATNIADYLAYDLRIPAVALGLGLIVLMALLAWGTQRRVRTGTADGRRVPDAGAIYWTTMLTAGVLGTVLGDDASHGLGEGGASIALALLLGGALLAARGVARTIAVYWALVALARTAGTALGDWLAENQTFDLGLSLSTLLTGVAFVGVLLVWRPATRD